MEKHAHSRMTRTRKAQGRDDLIHRQVHRTETRKVTEKVAVTEVLKAQQNFLVQVRQVKQTGHLAQTSRKEVTKGETHVKIGMFPNSQNSKGPGGCKCKDRCAYKHTGKLADETKHSASIPIHIPSNDERQVQIRKIQSDNKTQY